MALHVETERVVAAAPEAVHALLADYRTGRPRILPANFLDYGVDEGGTGAGTVVRYRLRAARRERAYRLRVEEPEPGRVLVERDTSSTFVTTWTLEPVDGGQRTRVRVASEWEGGRGVRGFFERRFAPGGLRRILEAMLDRLAAAFR